MRESASWRRERGASPSRAVSPRSTRISADGWISSGRAAPTSWYAPSTISTLISGGVCAPCCSGSGSAGASSFVVSSGWERGPAPHGNGSTRGARPCGRWVIAARWTTPSTSGTSRTTGSSRLSTGIARCIASSLLRNWHLRWTSCGPQGWHRFKRLTSPTPMPRRAGCEAHKSGSVGAGGG